ncbi:MAG: ShlB/FhaC/HecB family hemolysin secretion/activation protein [Bacillota bacterium]
MKGSALRFATAAWVACLLSTASFGAPPPPPPAPTPGQVQSSLPTRSPQPKPAQAPLSKTPVTPSGVAPGGPTFTVKRFVIEGNTVISTDELQAQIAGYVGKSMTLAELYDVADVLTRYYRAKGYGLADVAPPAQKITDGTVRLQVIEGRLGKITVQGNSRTRSSVLERRAAELKSGDVYTDAAAERAALLMNDIPGENVHGVLSQGAEFGTSDLLFSATETGYSGDVSMDDYGRAVLGRWRLNADVYLNSLTGGGDQLSAGITHSEGNLLNFGKLAYLVPFGTASTLTTSYNRAFYHVGGLSFGKLGIEGSTQNAGLMWQDAVERTQAQSLYWGLGLSYNNARNITGCCGTGAPVQDSLTTNILLLELTLLYTHQYEDQSYWTLNGQFWTNGKSNSDGTKKNAEKAHVEVDASWVKPFADVWSFVGQGAVAYSPDTLVDSDKYSLGGPGSVRGFQSAEARGDRGVFGSAELQREMNMGSKFPLAWGVFFDTGKVWTKAVGLASGTSTSLSSVGTELQLLPSSTGWTSRLQFAWAVGGTRPSDDVTVVEAASPANSTNPVRHDRGPHIWFTLAKAF